MSGGGSTGNGSAGKKNVPRVDSPHPDPRPAEEGQNESKGQEPDCEPDQNQGDDWVAQKSNCHNMEADCPPPPAAACCPPVIIRTKTLRNKPQCVHFTMPAINVCCEIPPPPKKKSKPKTCYIPIVICEEEEDDCEDPCQNPVHVDLGQCVTVSNAHTCGTGTRCVRRTRCPNYKRGCEGGGGYHRGCGGSGMGGAGWGRYH